VAQALAPHGGAGQNAARVRVLLQSDLPAVMPIENRCYDFPWTEGIFRDCFQSGHTGLALELADQLVGYGVLSAAAGEAHVLNVVIDTPFRGQGFGKRLVRRLLDQARWHRVGRVFLEVRRSNLGAIALYQSVGFESIGVRVGYYPARQSREDAIVMALTLSE
jgi:[ribosomal protein S18]-alanine N-acetyltransferase